MNTYYKNYENYLNQLDQLDDALRMLESAQDIILTVREILKGDYNQADSFDKVASTIQHDLMNEIDNARAPLIEELKKHMEGEKK